MSARTQMSPHKLSTVRELQKNTGSQVSTILDVTILSPMSNSSLLEFDVLITFKVIEKQDCHIVIYNLGFCITLIGKYNQSRKSAKPRSFIPDYIDLYTN